MNLEQFAQKLWAGSPWSSFPAVWENLPTERQEKWIEFARHVLCIMDEAGVRLAFSELGDIERPS